MEIPRKPKLAAEAPVAAQDNGVPVTNGKRKASDSLDAESATKKRAAPEGSEAENPDAKRDKLGDKSNGAASNDTVIVDDDSNGAILIDD